MAQHDPHHPFSAAAATAITTAIAIAEGPGPSTSSVSAAQAAQGAGKKLRLCEDVKRGVVCNNLTELMVKTPEAAIDALQRGIHHRQTAETLCNKNSSRSHSIFTVKMMIKEITLDGEEQIRYGQLNLVDLAGGGGWGSGVGLVEGGRP